VALRQQRGDKVAADEASAAGDEGVQGVPPLPGVGTIRRVFAGSR
jgi:hypothetical protein